MPLSQVEVGRPWARGLQLQLHPKAEEDPLAYPATSPPTPRPCPPPPLTIELVTQKPSGSKMHKPPKQEKNPGKEGENLNQESRGREGNQEKCYATRMPCHAVPRNANKALSTTQTKCRHMCLSNILQDRNLPPCSRTMVSATNANIVMQQHYKQPTTKESQKHSRT